MVDPCLECIVQAACKEYCEGKISYFSKLMSEYIKSQEHSRMFQHATSNEKLNTKGFFFRINKTGFVIFKKADSSQKIYIMDRHGMVKEYTGNKNMLKQPAFPF